jgi:ribose transport system substrate-binding protein
MKMNVKRHGLLGACLAGAVTLGVGAAPPAQAKTFAMVFKVLNNAFTPPLQAGCKAAAEKLHITCTFMGPQEYDEAAEVQMAQDMVQRGIDGLAVSAGNPKAMVRVLRLAKERHVPVVTFDSDVLPQDASLRATFIGTDNYQFGAKLAQLTQQLKPKGGTVCIQSGAPASLNLDGRIQGIRDTLAGVPKAQGVKRLTGQGGWTEPSGCPVYNNDNITLAAQQMFDVLTANPKLDAFVAVGGWAQYAPQAYRQAVGLQKERVASKELAIVFGDNFGPQMPLLKDGLSDFNVGQRPFDMAFKAIQTLNDLTDGKTAPSSIVTGLEVCTPKDTATCGKTPSE